MNAIDIIYSFDVVKGLFDEELYQRLYECWNITNSKIEVWGELQVVPHSKFINLFAVKTLTENRMISYPFRARYKIDFGVYIQLDYAKSLLNGESSQWIRCELELSPLVERKKHNNPFELSVKKGSAQRLVSMPLLDKNDIIEGEVESYITKTVYDFHLAKISTKINEEQTALELTHQQNVLKLTDELEKVENNHDQVKTALELAHQQSALKLTDELKKVESNHEQVKTALDERGGPHWLDTDLDFLSE